MSQVAEKTGTPQETVESLRTVSRDLTVGSAVIMQKMQTALLKMERVEARQI